MRLCNYQEGKDNGLEFACIANPSLKVGTIPINGYNTISRCRAGEHNKNCPFFRPLESVAQVKIEEKPMASTPPSTKSKVKAKQPKHPVRAD